MNDRKNPSEPNSESGENEESSPFLQRWARRKARAGLESSATDERETESRGVAGGDIDDDSKPQQATDNDRSRADPTSQGGLGEAEPDGGELEKGDEDMPPLDTIDQGGSVADFLSSRVSPALRQAALKRLFAQSSLPVGDALDDYAEDYTKFTKLGEIVTTEMRHRMDVVRQRLLDRKQETEQSEALAEQGSEPMKTPVAEPELQGKDNGQDRDSDDEEIAEADAERCSGDTRIAKENSKDDPDVG